MYDVRLLFARTLMISKRHGKRQVAIVATLNIGMCSIGVAAAIEASLYLNLQLTVPSATETKAA
jgi:hypothetical protein